MKTDHGWHASCKIPDLDALIASLYSAFAWEFTPEGFAYWRGIAKRLEEMRGEVAQDPSGKIRPPSP